ncbi:sel1 repeat family protein [Campylobacter sp. faydin G-24]|uniref:beta-lactamase n=1 Tax=Campylobacter anatolicus TaxID=2829105 RepID=A0ABS5HIS8_9BACT|nr:tetratricopeptide repeat protein [Campylobacter anatolicus]MBR8462669.1 sel1 repeat family protein [Campylobacter anatolicus]MBR8464163.1 sel1 repeat family protein [Campylobacter anatolicus]MBR8466068.1 sel1 repeat family protein [Campylobacter anatolicus]
MTKSVIVAILAILFFTGCFQTSRISLPNQGDLTSSSQTSEDLWQKEQTPKIEESKQQISKNAITILTPKCDDGDMAACNDTGANYEFLKNYENAFKFYEIACNGGVELGCANLGQLYENGIGIKKDPKKAVEIYKTSCNKGGRHSCYHLGNAYRRGDIVAQDYEMAMSAYTNACEAGDVPSCANIGAMYELGLGIEKDEVRAYKIYTVACYRGLNKACPQKERLGKKLGLE